MQKLSISGTVALLGLILAGQALARPHKTLRRTAPQSIGQFGDWQAATHSQGAQTICYAFARPESSKPGLASRGDVVLTVTERSKLRDTVALSAGFAYGAGAQAAITVGGRQFAMFTAGRSAFARDGAAVIRAFDQGDRAIVVSTGPKGAAVTDRFSLRGFGAAMKTVLAACPERR